MAPFNLTDQEKAKIREGLRKRRAASGPPIVTIFVRHSSGCAYAGDEFTKRCNCRKHFRWSQDGKQFRRQAGTRSWAEAEEGKRRLEDKLAGRAPTLPTRTTGHLIEECVRVFVQD